MLVQAALPKFMQLQPNPASGKALGTHGSSANAESACDQHHAREQLME